MAAGVLTINGTPRPVKDGTLRGFDRVNGRSSLRASIVSTTGAYIPDVDDDVIFEDDASNELFGGIITQPEQSWLVQGAGIVTTFDAEDYSTLAARRRLSATTSGGFTGRDAIDYIVTNYLAAYGVTRDAGMPAGATLGALTYDYAPVSDVLNDIVRLAAPAGWVWRIDSSLVLTAWAPGAGVPCPFTVTTGSSKIAGGDITVTRDRQYYANRVILVYSDGTATPAVATADDAGEQASYGIYETAIRADGPFDSATAQDIADAYLAKFLVRPRTISFVTLEQGARAGQTLSVNLAARSLVADFLITEVEYWDWQGKELFHKITAVEGGTLTASWKDQLGTWGGGSGSGLVSIGGGVVTSQVGRASYPLGGSMFAGQQSAGPSVINAVSYQDVMLDTAAIGAGTSVTAVVTCRAATAGAKVTPQIYNVTTAAVAGTGSQVTGVTPTTVAFTITVAAGQNTYRLRMTPDTANIDVFTQGYLEVGR